MFDVVGIGALNLDYIAALPEGAGIEAAAGTGLELGTETAVGEDVVHRVLGFLDPATVTASAGGSSFNVLHALAWARPELSLGYVGVAGRVPPGGVSGLDALTGRGVDTGVVGRSEQLSGVCLALTHAGDRTLLTHAGANRQTAHYLDGRFGELVAYLSRARVLHVTSFLDPDTPKSLLRLLAAVRGERPGIVLTVDPGHVWCAEPSPSVLGIMARADHLLLNRTELRLLAAHFGETGDEAACARVVRGTLAGETATVLVKAPDGIAVHGAGGDLTVGQKTLASGEIIDSTGAGDVFAAGLLAMLVAGSPAPREKEQVELGVRLGLSLARHKLLHLGSQGHPEFGAIARPFVRRAVC